MTLKIVSPKPLAEEKDWLFKKIWYFARKPRQVTYTGTSIMNNYFIIRGITMNTKQRQLCFFSRIFRSQMRKTPSNTLETLAIARTKKTTSITTKMKKIWRNCLKDVLRWGYLQLKTICSINLFFFHSSSQWQINGGWKF